MKILIKIVFFISLCIGIVYASLHPRYNWDMIPYMACVIQKTTPDSEACHAATYHLLRQELGDERYNKFSYNEYTLAMESDHEAFSENLPYYTIRIVYINIVNFFYQLGLPLYFSTILPSLVSVFLIILTLFFVLSKELKNTMIAAAISILILFLPPIIRMARLSTPDSLSALFLVIITVAYLYRSNWFLILLLMAISVMTRTDNIIWCYILLLLEALYSSEKKSKGLMLLFMLALALIYLIINHLYSNGGWEILFYSAFVERLSFPLSQTPSLTIGNYIWTMFTRTPEYLPWILLIFLGLYYLKIKNLKVLLKSRGSKIVLVCILSFFSKFVLFPSFDSRFYFVLILMLVLALAIEWKELIKLYIPKNETQK
ncbi:hypothetical protein [Labilibaculum sp.]|uniref:hypothetical protein n=1 Tax=Labilibaculum sp. TaxID=2060723 RepID=UPI003565E372